jgi:hypothetical protein
MISSPLMTGSYARRVPDYTAHNERDVPVADDAETADEADRIGGTDIDSA